MLNRVLGRYLGSKCGDSQLVRLSAEPVASQVDGPPEFVEILEDFTNIGPIVDFAVVPLDRQGQGQVPAEEYMVKNPKRPVLMQFCVIFAQGNNLVICY
jgi:hypothetical protein